MACQASGGNIILLCLGLLFVHCHCRSLTKLKSLDKFRGNSMPNRGQAKGNELHHGRLLIGQNDLHGAKPKGTEAAKKWMDIDVDYQADMGFVKSMHPEDHGYSTNTAVQQILKMEPKVECTGDSMKLQVQDSSTQGLLLFVDRGRSLSPLPLSKLPQSCGYSLQSTHRNLVLDAPYDGCFVSLEEDSYVLPLRWLGLPVRMSCPSMRQTQSNPPMVTCHAEGMVVRMECTISVSKIKVNVSGNWEPLMKSSSKCGFGVVEHPEGLVISVRYKPCLEIKDGMFTLELDADGETKISCPSMSPYRPEPTTIPKPETKLQTEAPRQKGHASTPPLSTTTIAPKFTTSRIPTITEMPMKPEEGSKNIYDPYLQYFPYYPHFFYPRPTNPDQTPTPTVQPTSLPVTQTNVAKTTAASATEGHPDPIKSQPESQLDGKVQPHVPIPESHPWYPEKVPQQPFLPSPPVSEDQTKFYQPFYPYVWPPGPYEWPLPPTAQTPTIVPQGEILPSITPMEPETPKPQTSEAVPPTKPTPGVKESQQTEVPGGGIYQQLYPNFFYPWPLPEEKPTAVPKPPQTKAPKGIIKPEKPVQQSEPVPEEKPTAVPKPPQTKAPKGIIKPEKPVQQSEQVPEEKPTAVPKPPQTKAPKGIYTPDKPVQLPEVKPTAGPNPPQPEGPQPPNTQVYQPVYPYPYPYPFYYQPEPEKPAMVPLPHPIVPQVPVNIPFYPQPEPEKPTDVSKRPQVPDDQVQYPFYYYPFYPQPNQPEESSTNTPPGKHQPGHPNSPTPLPTEKPTTLSKPPTKPPKSFPSTSQIPDTESKTDVPTENPAQSAQPPADKTPEDLMPQFFYPYYQYPQYVTLPPVPFTQKPEQITTTTSSPKSTDSMVPQPQSPQQSHPHIPPVYCPSFCPSGFSNCCPQIAFHQHLHHIVPAGPGSKDTPPVYTGLPFLNPAVYSGFGNSLHSTPSPPKPTEATTTSTAAPISTHSLLPQKENLQHLLPPDGTTAAHPTAEQKSKLSVPDQQQSDTASDRPEGHPKDQSELERFLVPYYMLQDPEAPAPINSTQQPGKDSKKLASHEQTLKARPDPRGFVLLQDPPGREHSGFNEPVMSVKHLVPELGFLQPNLAMPPPQGQSPQMAQSSKWLRKGLTNRLPVKGKDKRRHGVESEDFPLHVSASDGFPSVPSPQDLLIDASQPIPKSLNSFKQLWKPTTVRGSNHRIFPLVPEKANQHWSSAADQQEKGML
ncbi:uncharacterized protein [Antennarius striatus]|uniref:uncharacterized protein n=1 Tax=Antennarius striatus TaxID=241820 RepID=UPI0035ADCA3C